MSTLEDSSIQAIDIAHRQDFGGLMHDTQCLLSLSTLCIFLQINFLTATGINQPSGEYSDKIANDKSIV